MRFFKLFLYTLAVLAMIAVGVALFQLRLHDDLDAREFSNSDSGQTMFLQEVSSTFDVRSNGDLRVTEALGYDLGNETWRGLYQDFILPKGAEVKSVSVSRLSGNTELPLVPGSGIKLGKGGAYGSYGSGVVKDPDRRLRVVWNINDTDRQAFLVRYTLSNAAKNYQDASTLLWDVWGTGWETGVGTMSVRVRFPSDLEVFYPRAGDLQRRISNREVDGNVGSFTATNLPQKRQVQVRAAAAPLTRMPKQPENILPKLKAEQAVIDARNADYDKRSSELLDESYIWFAFKSLLAALIGLAFVMLCWMLMGRDKTRMVAAGGTYQYPPEKIPAPVIAKALGGAETENLVSATLLSLLQRDVFRVLPSVEKKEDVSIRNNVGEATFDTTKVESWELPIAEMLQTAIDAHPEKSPDFLKLKKFIPAGTAESKIAAYEKALKAQMPQYELKSTYRGRVRRWIIGIVAISLYTIGLVAIIGTDGGNAAARYDDMRVGLFMIGFFPVLVWAAVEGNAFYRLKDDQAERVRNWETYQDFFRKMDMSRDYPLTVEIWDEALIYAASFGFAKKVITNMPRTDAAGTPVVSNVSGAGIGWMAGNAAAAGTLGSMTSGISGVTGMASSSSSGGSGFSGGGGGGGGGGGW
ncbi:MAG: DUF2207 domain-containing protein [Solirubrobacterales bacterium]|nr:DUF2207 domain-containing protein [Solirubrobacterales bacterium]